MREKDPAPASGPVVAVELDGQAERHRARCSTGAVCGADQHACRCARASHAGAAARRAVITTPADHPARGDARVVRKAAGCGNVVQCRHSCPAAGTGVPRGRGERIRPRSSSGESCLLSSGSQSRSGPRASLAEKAHSSIGYFIFSLIFFFAAIIVTYLVPDRTQHPGRESTPGSWRSALGPRKEGKCH
jgi:hypothetical protein